MRRTALVAAVLLATLTGCGDGGASGSSPEASPTASDELARHDGRPCPTQLPAEEGRATEPASGVPELPAFTRAWVCRYQVETWTLAGEPLEVPHAALAEVETALGALAPAPADQMCTMDLGPRYLLVLSDGRDLTGIVVDAYGCRDVRLTDDPHSTPAGRSMAPGVPAGVFTAPGLLDKLVEIAGPA